MGSGSKQYRDWYRPQVGRGFFTPDGDVYGAEDLEGIEMIGR
jgi:hypothetical protein